MRIQDLWKALRRILRRLDEMLEWREIDPNDPRPWVVVLLVFLLAGCFADAVEPKACPAIPLTTAVYDCTVEQGCLVCTRRDAEGGE